VVIKGTKVTVDDVALGQLKTAINYIKKDSSQNALKVKNDIFTVAKSLPLQPEKFPLDKYKIDNDGGYRAFEKHHYRVTYRVTETEIRVLTIRHTSMEPFEY